MAANLFPPNGQLQAPNQPIILDIHPNQEPSSNLPLCLLINARSVYNKEKNLCEMLREIGPDFSIITETFEREKKQLSDVIKSREFQYFSYFRKNRSPGGGCAIVYNQNRFSVTSLEMTVKQEIETCWALVVPKSEGINTKRVKRIAVGAYYISPRSKFKQEVIEHIIDTIHLLRARYNNDVNFIIAGDFNRVDTSDVLDSYGALQSIVSVPTRKSATLEVILTDLHTMYHPPTTLPPLQVDEDRQGKDGDHNIVVFAPRSNEQYRVDRNKRTIITRPLPESNIIKFEQSIMLFPWEDQFENKSIDQKVQIFHDCLRGNLDKYFPEKKTKMSSLDKDWMSPQLKQLHRSLQREYYKHRRSERYKILKAKFKRLKRKSVKNTFSNFVTDLKLTNPGKWYSMAKKIGAVNKMSEGGIQVESLSEYDNAQCAQKIAERFSTISNEYSPVDNTQLPCYLPALPPPQVEEYQVYQRLCRIKKTKSTLPIDVPDKLRQECAVHLAAPLMNIYNDCLNKSVYPSLWKQEWVTPAPKVTYPQDISDLRKISCTSDYSKLFEGFIKDWVMEDISDNIDVGQYGGQEGLGTEHMIVCFLDRILQLLDSNPDKSAVIATYLDWSSAFDRQDPTLAIKKFIQIGVRPSLIPLLSSYLTDRKIQVKFNGEVSEILALIGGGPQGTLLGGTEYLVQSNDNADSVPEKDRFKYVDDLSILQLVCLAGLLLEYEFESHIASDIAIDQLYLPPETFQTQEHIDSISDWTRQNLMKLNVAKSNYMIFSRTKDCFTTRLKINEENLARIPVTKILGVWIQEDLSWSRNCKEICRKAFSRLSLITKLKYVGVSRKDLIDIYVLFIRSVAEYCSVSFHSSLTLEQRNKLEGIQRTCLKVILGDEYSDYRTALEICGLDTLENRRKQRCLDFSIKCLQHPRNKRLFPLNHKVNTHNLRIPEPYVVNFARTSSYKNSTIPYCQRLLNEHSMTNR